jgi:hypothetical protein
MRLAVSPAGRAVGPLLAAVILLNAIGLALPLTAIGLLIVRVVGFEGHPEVHTRRPPRNPSAAGKASPPSVQPRPYPASTPRRVPVLAKGMLPRHPAPSSALPSHPQHCVPAQALNVYYAIKFSPSFMVALFGMLSDSVDLQRGSSHSRQVRLTTPRQTELVRASHPYARPAIFFSALSAFPRASHQFSMRQYCGLDPRSGI